MEETNTSRKSFVSRWPVASFIGLTFSISYLLGVPFNILVSPLVTNTNEVIAGLLPRLITVYGPAIAAVILALSGAGPFSAKTLLKKLIPQSRYTGWCLAIPLICTLITFMSFAIAGVSATQLRHFLVNDWHWLVFQLVGQFFIVGIGEELGWRGWLLPAFAQRQPLMTCALLIIMIWGPWHFPIFLSGYKIVIPWLMILGSLTFLTTWLWVKVNGNVFVLAIMHASFNASEIFMENRLNDIRRGEDLILSGWATLGYVYVLIALIVVISSREIWSTRWRKRGDISSTV